MGEEDTRIVVDMLGEVPDIDLPEGWIGLAHKTGAIVYMHRDTRVVTWSRPYKLGKHGSLRKHDPPLIAIPCLHQLNSKETRVNNDNNAENNKRKYTEGHHANFELPRKKLKEQTESNHSCKSDDKKEKSSLPGFSTIDFDTLHNYIGKIFDFKDHATWKLPLFSDEQLKKTQTLPEKKKPAISVENKSPLQVLYEYNQNILKESFSVEKLASDKLVDFYVEINIGDLKYGIAKGDTLKKAKQDAAAITLSILDPQLCPNLNPIGEDEEAEMFDDIKIESEEVIQIMKNKSKKMKTPYESLVKLIHRNFEDFKESDLRYSTKNGYRSLKCKKRDNLDVTIPVSKENEGLGRDIAAQHMIKKLYPILQYWGSVVRLSQLEPPSIPNDDARRQTKATNKFMLALKDEMRKL